MIENLFSSLALYKTLALFFEYPDEPLNPRLISRYTRTEMKSVLRELNKLEEMGVLRVREAGRYRMYAMNRRHLAFPGLRSIFGRSRKARESMHQDPLARLLEELSERPDPG